jgi:hypothetical protein
VTVQPGDIESKTREDVSALVTAHPMGESLAALAFFLARTLDQGPESKAVAGIALQLRSTLVELARLGVEGDDDFDAQMSSPVLDPEEPGEGDSGTGGR